MKHNLEHHIKDRHIKPHKCNICEKGFGSEWMLEKHKNVTHLGLKPHVCNLCHEGFGGYAGNYAHFSIHHGMWSDSARTEAYRWEWKILHQLTWKKQDKIFHLIWVKVGD